MSQSESSPSTRPIRYLQTIPILRIFDVAKAKAFYVDYLGFSVDWEHRFEDGLPLYFQVSRGELTLHLSEHHGDCTPGSTAFVIMNGLREFHREITAKKHPNLRPGIRKMPWSAEMMEVTDPFGNRIRFNEYMRERRANSTERSQAPEARGNEKQKKSSRSKA